ncbi:MAG: YjfB family protein [Lachnospiraceae bacterium]|nr:YjfB family protein [Lachnospiraceae bacterium]
MELSGLMMSVSPGSINTGLELAVLNKALDTAQDAGEALTEMMGQAAMVPGLGQYIDVRA